MLECPVNFILIILPIYPGTHKHVWFCSPGSSAFTSCSQFTWHNGYKTRNVNISSVLLQKTFGIIQSIKVRPGMCTFYRDPVGIEGQPSRSLISTALPSIRLNFPWLSSSSSAFAFCRSTLKFVLVLTNLNVWTWRGSPDDVVEPVSGPWRDRCSLYNPIRTFL